MKNKNILVVVIGIALLFTACGKVSDVDKAEEIYTKNLLSLKNDDGRKLDEDKTYILRFVKAFDSADFKQTKKKFRPKIEITAECKIRSGSGTRKIYVAKILDTRIVTPKSRGEYAFKGDCIVITGRTAYENGLFISSQMHFSAGKYPTELVKMQVNPKARYHKYFFSYDTDKYKKIGMDYGWSFTDIVRMEEMDYIQILNY